MHELIGVLSYPICILATVLCSTLNLHKVNSWEILEKTIAGLLQCTRSATRVPGSLLSWNWAEFKKIQ